MMCPAHVCCAHHCTRSSQHDNFDDCRSLLQVSFAGLFCRSLLQVSLHVHGRLLCHPMCATHLITAAPQFCVRMCVSRSFSGRSFHDCTSLLQVSFAGLFSRAWGSFVTFDVCCTLDHYSTPTSCMRVSRQ